MLIGYDGVPNWQSDWVAGIEVTGDRSLERLSRRERFFGALAILLPPLAVVLLCVPRWRAVAVKGLLAWGHAVLALATFLVFAATNAQRLDAGDRSADLWMFFLFVWVATALVIPLGLAIRQLVTGTGSSAAAHPWEVAIRFRSDDASGSLVAGVERWLAGQPGVRVVDGGWIVIDPAVVEGRGASSVLRVVRGVLALLPEDDRSAVVAVYRLRPSSLWSLTRTLWSRTVRDQALVLAARWQARAEAIEPPTLPPAVERALEEGLQLTHALDRLDVRRADLVTLGAVAATTTVLVVMLEFRVSPDVDGALAGLAGLLAGIVSAMILGFAWLAYRVRLLLRAFAASSDRPPRVSLAALVRRWPGLLPLALAGALAFVVSLGWTLSPEAPEWSLLVSIALLVLPVLVALWLGTRLAEQPPPGST